MKYEKEILETLYEAGNDGLSVHKIAIHVRNQRNTLFSPIDFDNVRIDVQRWLLANSRHSTAPVEHCEKRGLYRLNPKSNETQKLMLQFGENNDKNEDTYKDNQKNNTQILLFDF